MYTTALTRPCVRRRALGHGVAVAFAVAVTAGISILVDVVVVVVISGLGVSSVVIGQRVRVLLARRRTVVNLTHGFKTLPHHL